MTAHDAHRTSGDRTTYAHHLHWCHFEETLTICCYGLVRRTSGSCSGQKPRYCLTRNGARARSDGLPWRCLIAPCQEGPASRSARRRATRWASREGG
jgi:hypothetical protein